jgi:hypothetical protein
MMLALRIALAAVALSNAITGAQAVAAPRGFYDGFPLGREWVAALPAYNEHLTTDVGAFFLAFAVLFTWAAVRPRRALVVPLSVAWGVFGVIHLAFPVRHLDGFGAADAIAQTTGLAAVLAPCLLAALAYRARAATPARAVPASLPPRSGIRG